MVARPTIDDAVKSIMDDYLFMGFPYPPEASPQVSAGQFAVETMDARTLANAISTMCFGKTSLDMADWVVDYCCAGLPAWLKANHGGIIAHRLYAMVEQWESDNPEAARLHLQSLLQPTGEQLGN